MGMMIFDLMRKYIVYILQYRIPSESLATSFPLSSTVAFLRICTVLGKPQQMSHERTKEFSGVITMTQISSGLKENNDKNINLQLREKTE